MPRPFSDNSAKGQYGLETGDKSQGCSETCKGHGRLEVLVPRVRALCKYWCQGPWLFRQWCQGPRLFRQWHQVTGLSRDIGAKDH
jgi:hypothetical protein